MLLSVRLYQSGVDCLQVARLTYFKGKGGRVLVYLYKGW